MKVRPMIFNAEMVQALLDGRKTVTRRPVSPLIAENAMFMGGSGEAMGDIDFLGLTYCAWQDEKGEPRPPEFCLYSTEYPEEGIAPIGQGIACVGDLIYVRETWREFKHSDECGCSDYCGCPATGTIRYFASHDDGESKWKPSIHMPRSASRITLKVTDVRMEQVQDITDEQAVMEGMPTDEECQQSAIKAGLGWYQKPAVWFQHLWDEVYNNWQKNPIVWVIEFEVIQANVDSVLRELES